MILCGLRRGELGGLTWGDVDERTQALHVSPRYDKAGREGWVAIRPDLLADLHHWREVCDNAPDDARVFGLAHQLAPILKKDLREAGIEFETHAGRADVHSFRTTCASWLATVAVPAVYRQHLRHGERTVTERHYVKLGLRDTHAAVAKLPALPLAASDALAALEATGTDDSAGVLMDKLRYKSSDRRNTRRVGGIRRAPDRKRSRNV
jgi:integrase